jgi:hypothetical protein
MFPELIHSKDSEETTSLISKVISSATEEIQMIFSHADTLRQYERLGMFGVVRRKADNGILVRILVGMDSSIKGNNLDWLNSYPQIELCYLNKSIQTKLTTIVTNRELSLVIEEKGTGDALGLGLATQIVSQRFSLTFPYLRTYGCSQQLKVRQPPNRIQFLLPLPQLFQYQRSDSLL